MIDLSKLKSTSDQVDIKMDNLESVTRPVTLSDFPDAPLSPNQKTLVRSGRIVK